MKKLSYWQLVRKIQGGSISTRLASRVFKIDATASRTSLPVFTIDPAVVDISGMEYAALASADGLARAADTVLRVKEREKGTMRTLAADGGIVAEGDSWFKLPWFYSRTLVDALSERYSILNLAHWGDTLREMLTAGEYVPHLKGTRFLLWSGGGNDILGDTLEQALDLYDGIHDQPSEAGFYVNAFFYNELARIDAEYRSLCRTLANDHPKLKIVVHGYDYARPFPNGNFLGKQMENRNFDPAHRPELCLAVVKVMVDAFNEKLRSIAGAHSNLIYVDLRCSLGKNDWFDELHPKGCGPAHRLADKFAAILGTPSAAMATSKSTRPKKIGVVSTAIPKKKGKSAGIV